MEEIALTIQLCVSDLGTTEAFYAGILGLPLQRPVTVLGAPEHLLLETELCQVIFVEDAAVGQLHPILQARLEGFPRGVGMTLHLVVEGIEEIYQELLEEDLEILYPLERKPYGTWELWCFDPDGYLVVLEEPVD
ncbi:VOC family protein [Geomonas sp. Red69]|uniref:VOC family protein n=1 Tax=Geomonas diazotrophica TaxID=2843197 RepID=A0ABX8JHR9_9BACT|nr:MULTISPECIES: VOC family protein [Geomonas]MBU5636037.1 VOC family protein [Geomonas diazotrophica]QWV96787.1 VOC family protein [Geomonas nitrogeniifigens]QXE85887.1 VOC family protein [Geomonas nitrogeniifigens]